MDALERNNMWEITTLLRWAFIIKYQPYDIIERYKACLVTKWYIHTYLIDYYKTLTSVAKMSNFHIIIVVAIAIGQPLH